MLLLLMFAPTGNFVSACVVIVTFLGVERYCSHAKCGFPKCP